jgi:hypothetical protein
MQVRAVLLSHFLYFKQAHRTPRPLRIPVHCAASISHEPEHLVYVLAIAYPAYEHRKRGLALVVQTTERNACSKRGSDDNRARSKLRAGDLIPFKCYPGNGNVGGSTRNAAGSAGKAKTAFPRQLVQGAVVLQAGIVEGYDNAPGSFERCFRADHEHVLPNGCVRCQQPPRSQQ